MTNTHSPLQPKIILGIAAHPDDLDVCAAGTLAHYASLGAEIHYLILTDGGKGSDDPSITSAQLVEIRHAEQKTGLEIVGGKSISFLDYPDGELEVTMELKQQIVKVIRTIKPDVVITMDPTVIYSAVNGIINHPDHRAAGQATLDAVFPLARDHLSFPELHTDGFQPHKTATILLVNFNDSNFAIDITKTYDTKIKALRAHPSQFSPSNNLDWVHNFAQSQGEKYGYELAESFVRIDIN